jgi:hypothetical protein
MCDLLFNCIDGQVVQSTGLFHLLIYFSAFSLCSIFLLARETKSGESDTPTPWSIALGIIGLISAVIAAVAYAFIYLIINRPTTLIIGIGALFFALIIFFLSLYVRNRKWK